MNRPADTVDTMLDSTTWTVVVPEKLFAEWNWPSAVDSTSSVTVHVVVAVTMRNSRPLLVNCRVVLVSPVPPTRRAAVMSSPPPSATSGVGVRGWATDHSFLSAADGVTSGGVAGRTTGGVAGTRGGGAMSTPTTTACGCG